MKKGLLYVIGLLCLFFAMFYFSKLFEGIGGGIEEEHTNVIVILIDALRADQLGCYGYHRETTPNLDRFSKEAVTFKRATSQTSWTKPSIPSLFTSLYPSRHGVLEGSSKDTKGHITSDILADSLLTLAEAFRGHGYSTVAFVHNAQLRGFLGFAQGFDLYQDRAGDAEHINVEFENWLDQRTGGSFFAYLHYLDVHWPYQPPAPYDPMFGTYSSGIDFNTDEWKALRKDINNGRVNLSDEDLGKMVALYDGELRYLDDQLGSLFSDLRRRGLYTNSLVIVTADHGEEFLEHDKIGHGQSLYRELLWIPLMIKFPGGKWHGREVEDMAGLIDVLPTLADYLGWEPPADTDGRSLMPVLTGRNDREDSTPYTYSELYHKGSYQRSLTGDRYELIETYSGTFRNSTKPSLLKDFHVGDRVNVEGVPGREHTFLAKRIALNDNQSDRDHELEGPISSIEPGGETFTLMGFRVVPDPKVVVKTSDGESRRLAELREGMKVKLNGHVRPGYIFKANRVKVKGLVGRRFKLEGLIEDIEEGANDSVLVSMMGLRVVIQGETGNAPVNTEGSGGKPISLVDVELFDIRKDPWEKRNLADSLPDLTQRLRSLMREGYPFLAKETPLHSTGVRELDKETVEELKAIGYVQ